MKTVWVAARCKSSWPLCEVWACITCRLDFVKYYCFYKLGLICVLCVYCTAYKTIRRTFFWQTVLVKNSLSVIEQTQWHSLVHRLSSCFFISTGRNWMFLNWMLCYCMLSTKKICTASCVLCHSYKCYVA